MFRPQGLVSDPWLLNALTPTQSRKLFLHVLAVPAVLASGSKQILRGQCRCLGACPPAAVQDTLALVKAPSAPSLHSLICSWHKQDVENTGSVAPSHVPDSINLLLLVEYPTKLLASWFFLPAQGDEGWGAQLTAGTHAEHPMRMSGGGGSAKLLEEAVEIMKGGGGKQGRG